MGFLSTLTGALKEGARQGIATGITSAIRSSSILDFSNMQKAENIVFDMDNVMYSDTNKYSEIFKTGTLSSNITSAKNTNVISENSANKNIAKKMSTHIEIPTPDRGVVDDSFTDVLNFEIPDWSYADWINERSLWQKQITSIFDEPGYFYFKVFFRFNTQHGLFGGLLNNAKFTNAINSAAKYLYISKHMYKQERPLERITALFKFASILSYINTSAPWYFKGIKGLDECARPKLENFSDKKTIELELSQDAIDMRLSTLMSLYKFACYDDINCKEIIPENLRKFDMIVIVFAAPIKRFHTSIIHSSGGVEEKFNYKSLSPLNGSRTDWSNVMSYKMYTFNNCEFDIESLGSYMPNGINNSEPFKLGENSIKISYDRVYEHQMNEFFGIMFGSDGIYYNQYSAWQWGALTGNEQRSDLINSVSGNLNTQEKRYAALQDAIESNYKYSQSINLIDTTDQNITNKIKSAQATYHKKVIEASEGLVHDRLMSVNSAYALGNIYGEDKLIASSYKSGKPVLTDYYKMKLRHLKNRLSTLKMAGINVLLNMLQSSYSANSYFGNLYGDVGIGSAYWREKLKLLKNSNKRPSDVYEYRKNQQSYNSFNLQDYMFSTTRSKK